MKKLFSLIKACMSSDMNLFIINNKNKKKGKKSSKALPIFIYIFLMFLFFAYSNMFMEYLENTSLEFVTITLFIFLSFILIQVEGIYKTSSLLFNCKDDDMLLSLPIKRSTVLFVRIFKFYVFEFLYNTVFVLPAMIAYAMRVDVSWSFYLVSFIALLLLPIIPIAISCIIGVIISSFSSRFRFKNIAQIVFTSLFFVGLMYVSFNLTNIIKDLAASASSINDIITGLYYPAGGYNNLIMNFNVMDLLIYVGIHLGIFIVVVFLISKVYFRINTRIKSVKSKTGNKKYTIKTNSVMGALVKKELNRFIGSPVFITNAGFGLLLFIILAIVIVFKFDMFASILSSQGVSITIEQAKAYTPALLFGLVLFASFMTSITSSMISLEGRTFNILKSLPVSSEKIIYSKILMSTIVMVPCILIGDIIIFLNFDFNILEILMILVASVVLPLISGLIGIIMNIKYPKMDAINDSEVVKQSMSATVAVFLGMGLLAVSGFGLYNLVKKMGTDLAILTLLSIFIVILLGLIIYLKKKSIKDFDAINV